MPIGRRRSGHRRPLAERLVRGLAPRRPSRRVTPSPAAGPATASRDLRPPLPWRPATALIGAFSLVRALIRRPSPSTAAGRDDLGRWRGDRPGEQHPGTAAMPRPTWHRWLDGTATWRRHPLAPLRRRGVGPCHGVPPGPPWPSTPTIALGPGLATAGHCGGLGRLHPRPGRRTAARPDRPWMPQRSSGSIPLAWSAGQAGGRLVGALRSTRARHPLAGHAPVSPWPTPSTWPTGPLWRREVVALPDPLVHGPGPWRLVFAFASNAVWRGRGWLVRDFAAHRRATARERLPAASTDAALTWRRPSGCPGDGPEVLRRAARDPWPEMAAPDGTAADLAAWPSSLPRPRLGLAPACASWPAVVASPWSRGSSRERDRRRPRPRGDSAAQSGHGCGGPGVDGDRDPAHRGLASTIFAVGAWCAPGPWTARPSRWSGTAATGLGRRVAAGVYIVRLGAQGRTRTRKVDMAPLMRSPRSCSCCSCSPPRQRAPWCTTRGWPASRWGSSAIPTRSCWPTAGRAVSWSP